MYLTERDVSDGPSSFLLTLEITFSQHLDQWPDDIVSNQCLDLDSIARCYVGHGPRSLLDDVQLGMAQQFSQQWASTCSQDAVGLYIAPGDDVANGAQSGSHDRDLHVLKKSHEARHDTAVYNFLNALVGTVSQIRKGPAGISQNLLVVVVDQVSKSGEQLPHSWHARWRVLVATQVGLSPRHVPQKSGLKVNSKRI